MFKLPIVIIIAFTILVIKCSSIEEKSKTALFISIPFIGHLNPLLHQANELYQRNGNKYNIYIISCSNMKKHVERNCLNTTIKFIDIGQCSNETELELVINNAIINSNSFSSKLTLVEIILKKIYPQMYEQALKSIDPNIFVAQEKIIAIIDIITFAGVDIADYFNIPYIINNADLLPYLSWYDVLPSDYNPTVLYHPPQSIHTIERNLFLRTILPITRCLLTIYTYVQFDRPLNYIRQNKFHLNNSVNFVSRYYSHMILVNSVFGIEYAQHLPPYVQCTGPMFSVKHTSDYYLKQLLDEDRQWLEMDSRPIIYINFGTVVLLTSEQIEKIYLTIKSFDKYRVIWKLNQIYDFPTELPSRIRIVPWISSTLGYLAHPNVQLFLSHCGINSAYESIWLGTSILCIPFLGDQHDMAQRLIDANVGRSLDKLTFTPEELRETIEIMFKEDEILFSQENIKRIQRIIRLNGGVERAVDLIEMVADYGFQAFIPIENSYPWYVYYNFDVYTIWLLSSLVILQLILRCCCCCSYYHRRTRSDETSIKMKTS
ncbi:unnamed protein product [Adineta steineri]|uniref:Glucuronosyltransferase n=1 Tax=Adineta steineri TaxID=433720 RepID=A0A814LZF7_9BILA|nr:unnamed protein product [Adineta steineri]CAF3591420.1 unnamed protein product [Adineta steineri]